MPTYTPPWAANQIWFGVGKETSFGQESTNIYYIGVLARSALPAMEQNQNMRPDYCVGSRAPIGFTPGAQRPRGSVRLECLPAFGMFASEAFTLGTNGGFVFPLSLPSYTFVAVGWYLSGQPFIYKWTGSVVSQATFRWAEEEKLICDFAWESAYAWIEYSFNNFGANPMQLNVGEHPLVWHEGSFADYGLQGINNTWAIRSGTVQITRRLHRAYGCGGASPFAQKRAARGAWNIAVLSHTVGADFVTYAPDGFASGPNVGANAPKWYSIGQAVLQWSDSYTGNWLRINLHRVEPNTSRMNAAAAEDVATFGFDWMVGDITTTYGS